MIGSKLRFRRPAAAAPAPGRWGGVTTMLLAVVQAALIAWFTFSLSGKLELALKERKASLEAVQAMDKLIDALQNDKIDNHTRSILIRKLAMYEVNAIPLLIMLAADTGPYSEELPVKGLRLIATQHRKQTCQAVGQALEVQPGIDHARFKAIQKLHGELKC